MSIENKLKELDIILPKAPDPVGAYVAFKKIGNLLFISGQLPISSDGKMIKGKIGKNLTVEDGQTASKLCVMNILAQAKKAMKPKTIEVKSLKIEVRVLEKKDIEQRNSNLSI